MSTPEVKEVKSVALMSRRLLPWPKRLDIALLSFFAMMIALCDRINMSVAAPVLMKERGWDTVQMGWVLSGFFIGYSLMMIPSGIIADRYSPKWVLAFCIAWWSFFTALTPLPNSLVAMTVLRILMGAGESGMMPCVNSILVRWFPRHEYSRATTFSWSGGSVGAIVAFPLASTILSYWGWPAVFLVFASLGAVWLPFWIKGVTDDPADCHNLPKSELAHILNGRPALATVNRVPWKHILLLPPLFALMVLHFSFNWIAYVLASWLPTYLMAERHFSLAKMAIGSSLPFVSILLGGNLFGVLIDRYSLRYDRTRVRKVFVIPFLMAGGSLLLVPVVTSQVLTVVCLCVSAGLISGAYPVITSGSLDIAPRYAGTVVALQNCIANFSGVLVPIVTGYVVKVFGWGAVFYLSSVICGIGFLAYIIFGQAKKLVD